MEMVFGHSKVCYGTLASSWHAILATKFCLAAFDSYGKVPNDGELSGNFFHMGSYSSCLEVEAKTGLAKEFPFRGKYCNLLAIPGGEVDQLGLVTPLLPPFDQFFNNPSSGVRVWKSVIVIENHMDKLLFFRHTSQPFHEGWVCAFLARVHSKMWIWHCRTRVKPWQRQVYLLQLSIALPKTKH